MALPHKPTKTFTGEVGVASTGANGPSAIQTDITDIIAMFDSGLTHVGGNAGGIHKGNLATSSGILTDESQVILEDVNGDLTVTRDVISGRNFVGSLSGDSSDIIRLANTTNIASLGTTTHAFQIGADSGINLRLDNNDIMVENNGAASTLKINRLGGDVEIGAVGGTGIVKINNNPAITCTSGEVVYKKIIEIGDWNMNSVLTLDVAHGLSLSKIKKVNVLIRNDADTEYYPLDTVLVTGIVNGYYYLNTTNVRLYVNGLGSYFCSTAFDKTSWNRGWITIEYTN